MSARVNRRRALVMADQGVSSLSNVVVSIIAARSLSADGFGAFSAAMVAFMLVQGVCRAVIGEPLLSRYSSSDATVRSALVSDIIGGALVTSLAGSLVVGVAGLAVGGTVGPALLAVALVVPLVTVQDTWRYVFMIDRAGAALAVDVVWLVSVCAVLPMAPGGAGPAWFLGAWGVTAGLGALVGLLFVAGTLSVPHPTRWLYANRDMSSRFLGEFVTGQSIGQVVLIALSAISGLSVIGAVRATQVFYGPLNTVHQGIYLALVPEGAQAASPARLRRLMVKASVLLMAVAVVWMCIGLTLPDAWGSWLFRDTWGLADDLMLPMGLAMIAGSASTGGFAGVRALGAARESLRARLLTLGPQLALPLAGAAMAAGTGFAVGFGLANAASAVIWWSAFGAALATTNRAKLSERTEMELAIDASTRSAAPI